jgi:hypothetical protein
MYSGKIAVPPGGGGIVYVISDYIKLKIKILVTILFTCHLLKMDQ